MSQSSGAPGGFNINKTQINKQLQLLKSTFKYKNTSEFNQNEQTFEHSERIKYEVPVAKAESEHNVRVQKQKLPKQNNTNNFMTPNNRELEETVHDQLGMSNISSKQKITTKEQPNGAGVGGFRRQSKGPIKAVPVIRQQDSLQTIHFDD